MIAFSISLFHFSSNIFCKTADFGEQHLVFCSTLDTTKCNDIFFEYSDILNSWNAMIFNWAQSFFHFFDSSSFWLSFPAQVILVSALHIWLAPICPSLSPSFASSRPVFDNDISIRNVLWSWLTHRWLGEMHIFSPTVPQFPIKTVWGCQTGLFFLLVWYWN